MKRRDFILALGGAAASPALWPRIARAEEAARMRRVGVVVVPDENQPVAQDYLAAFRKGLAEFGWIEGRNIRVDFRFGGGNPDRAKAIAAELVAASPDVILAQGTPAR